MIPKFPDFKKLEQSDRKEFEQSTSKFLPYSDFNFTSMWIWNINDSMMVSQLNNNAVVIFSDYLSEKPLLSFIGKNKLSETTLELIAFSAKNYQMDSLQLIPEDMADTLVEGGFNVTPDINSYDYIYSVAHLASMNNWPRSNLGKRIRQFTRLNPDYVVKLSSIQEISNNKHLEIFERWARNKDIEDILEINEYKAFKRLLQVEDKNIKVVSLYLKDALVGFTVYEILSNDYAISHFAKADINQHPAIYDVLNWEEAKILNTGGVKYYNWEQDLGIQSLRYSKEKYKPSFFLKKFIVNNKQ